MASSRTETEQALAECSEWLEIVWTERRGASVTVNPLGGDDGDGHDGAAQRAAWAARFEQLVRALPKAAGKIRQISLKPVEIELAGDGRPAPAARSGDCCGLPSWAPLGRRADPKTAVRAISIYRATEKYSEA